MSKKYVVIVGLGKTGLSCVRYCKSLGNEVAVTDSRADPPNLAELKNEFPDVPISLGGFDADLCSNAQELIVSPGVSLREPAIAQAIKHGVPAIGDVELFARVTKAPKAVITGSNGKSTVTTLVGEMAKWVWQDVGVGGNLGTPVLDLIQKPEPKAYVLELSSFQLETTYSLKPKVAAILNITPDHLDRYDHMDDYIAAKQRIYHGCETAVFNREDKATFPSATVKKKISFGLNPPIHEDFGLRVVKGKEYLAQGKTLLLPVSELKIKGRHQIANALAALAIGWSLGLPIEKILTPLSQFTGLTHRCQWIRNLREVDWYNDSKATNVASAKAAIEGLGQDIKGKLILIAGGLGKNADFTELNQAVKQYVRHLILIGQDAPIIAQALAQATNITHAATLADAIQFAQENAQSGDAVLLAPACASYDMFKNYEHRGEVFMDLVRTLA